MAMTLNEFLITSISNNDKENVLKAIDDGADSLKGMDAAVSFRSIDMVRLLLEKGVDPHKAIEMGFHDSRMVLQDYLPILKLLLNHCDDF